MDNTQDVTEWHHATFLQSVNVTPEEVCANIDVNAGRPLPFVDFKRICICASGPSLADHIEDVRARQKAGYSVASMNGSHNFLIEHGIVPDYYFQIDARKGNMAFLDKANDHTTYIVASQCQPEIFEALAGRKLLLWQVHNYPGAQDAILAKSPRTTLFGGAYNVGQSCLIPIFAMGYRVWHLFGYDGSMKEGDKHAFDQPQNADEEVHEVMFRDKHYSATGTMAHHAQTFVDRWKTFKSYGIDIQILSEGLLPDMVAEQAELYEAMNEPAMTPPPPRPRKRAVERLPIVTMKWKGHIPYEANDVNVLSSMVDRWLDMPAEMVCITDDPEGIDGGIRTIPLWRDHFEHGKDWHRLKLFTEEMADLIGPRFVVMDLDTVICGPVDFLFSQQAPFKAWQDPFRPNQYCTAVFQMDAGAFPHVFDSFDVNKAMQMRQSGRYNGYDQAWVSFALPNQPVWTERDGVLSFKRDILNNDDLTLGRKSGKALPPHARIINFHGKYNPRDAAVQEACPWIKEYWK